MTISFRHAKPRTIIHTGTILFTLSIALAYVIYPHWVTLSHFAEQWDTLIPFMFAMLVAMLELAYIAAKVRKHNSLTLGSSFLYASAFFIGLVICIPYLGSATQKNMHDLVALLFALSTAIGFATLAKQLHDYLLGTLSGMIFVICLLELVFLARYKVHPVRPWAWTVLELAAIAALITGLDVIVVAMGRGREPAGLEPS